MSLLTDAKQFDEFVKRIADWQDGMEESLVRSVTIAGRAPGTVQLSPQETIMRAMLYPQLVRGALEAKQLRQAARKLGREDGT